VLEVDAVPGLALRDGVADDVAAGLAGVVDKPAGIEVRIDSALDAGGDDHGWTIEELDALAGASDDLSVDAATIKIHVLLVDGHHVDDGPDGQVLGVAWSHRNLALFMDTIEGACGVVLPALLREQGCAAAELAITTHELGHLIGLVDNGLEMVDDHRDADHGAHDVSQDCVMYYAYDGDALVTEVADDLLAGGDGRLGFDSACLADVAAVRDR
ncbi:MAG: hypothetical protein H0W24_04030, partial [Lysobacter sp.]|nr:hypothetical protein [Lysobacter sp.]